MTKRVYILFMDMGCGESDVEGATTDKEVAEQWERKRNCFIQEFVLIENLGDFEEWLNS